MIIQNILPPRKNLKSLYIKELDPLRREKENRSNFDIDIAFPIRLNKGDIISFESYVNALPIEKWTRYTKANNIGVTLRICGEVNIQIYNSIGVYDWDENLRSAGRKEIDVDISCSDKRDYKEYSITLREQNQVGLIYPIIEAFEDCELFGGEYTVDAPEEILQPKLCYIVNYNKDANVTRRVINMITGQESYDNESIIICDNTANLNKDVFIDSTQKNSNIIQIKTDIEKGYSYNKALNYIRRQKKEGCTHAILIDVGVDIAFDTFDRLKSFIAILDDIRKDMIIQGDILNGNTHIDGSGYILKNNVPQNRFNDFVLTKHEDIVIATSQEEVDFFKFGLVCVPLNCIQPFNPSLRECIELDYYLHNKKYNITSINGFAGVKKNSDKEGLIYNNYYCYRDYFIAIVDSEFELDKTEYRLYIEKEMKAESKKGNVELAFSILEAANDFLNGPDGLYDEYCLEEINDRLKELSQRFNDSIVGRKNIIKDKLELQKLYNKICLKIDHSYDMIMEKWTEHKRKVDNEREQQ